MKPSLRADDLPETLSATYQPPANDTDVSAADQPPLCVDLDGTLVRTDLLIEAALLLVKQDLLSMLKMPFWLCKGKAHLKDQIARRISLDPARLPYHEALIDYLKEQKASQRRIVLATASHEKHASQVAEHLDLFSDVIATDATVNLSGKRKRNRLIEMFGERGFDYAGNGVVDLDVWTHARSAIVVDASKRVTNRARRIASIERIIESPPTRWTRYMRALRIHQWIKNLLLFVPLVLAHAVQQPGLVLQAVFAFLAFGFCASSVYILNDLLDLPVDRVHPRKRHRPFAAGTIPIEQGVFLIPILLTAALGFSMLLPPMFLGALGLYYVVTLAYSLRLKRAVLLDVLTLAGLYTMRILAGAAATGVALSAWLLAFSMFFFLSLALVKRYAELLTVQKANGDAAEGRSYGVIDLETLAQFGITSGYMAILVLALYINSSAVSVLYRHPGLIWLICPVLLYWISNMWLLTRRDCMHDDPVVFAIRDRRSHWIALVIAVIVWAAT